MGKDNYVAAKAKRETPDVLGAIFADKLRPTMVAAASIRTDGGTQMRAGLNDAIVFDYGQTMIAADGWGTFPPAVAYHDGATYWLADGFHRVAAFLESFPDPKKTIPVDVRAGTRRDAVLHAAGANAEHGLRRTNEDKRRAVETLLRDEEWAAWSSREIARACNVSDVFVGHVRTALTANVSSEKPAERTYTTKHGTTATMQTSKIGSKPARPAAPVLNTAAPVERIEVTSFADTEPVFIDAGPAAESFGQVDPDEEIAHPLDSYDPENVPPLASRMGKLHELKMWFKATQKEKVAEYQKLTGNDVAAGFISSLDYMIRALDEEMGALQERLETEGPNVNQ